MPSDWGVEFLHITGARGCRAAGTFSEIRKEALIFLVTKNCAANFLLFTFIFYFLLNKEHAWPSVLQCLVNGTCKVSNSWSHKKKKIKRWLAAGNEGVKNPLACQPQSLLNQARNSFFPPEKVINIVCDSSVLPKSKSLSTLQGYRTCRSWQCGGTGGGRGTLPLMIGL